MRRTKTFTVMRCSATLAPHARSRRGRAARADAAPAPDTGEEHPREHSGPGRARLTEITTGGDLRPCGRAPAGGTLGIWSAGIKRYAKSRGRGGPPIPVSPRGHAVAPLGPWSRS